MSAGVIAQKHQSLVANALSSWGVAGINIVVLFALTPFVVTMLGQNGYGIWVLVQSFTGFYGLLNVGVGSAVTRYVARYSSQGDFDALNRVASTSLVTFSASAAIALVVSFLLGGPLSGFFQGVDAHNVDDFKYLVWIMGMTIAIGFVSGVYGGVLAAHERYVVANAINVASTLLRALLTVVFLLQGHGLVGAGLAVLISMVLLLVGFYVTCQRELPHVQVRMGLAQWSVFKTLIVYGSATFVISVADILIANVDSLVIGRMIGVDQIAIYGIASLLVRRLLRTMVGGIGVLTPRFAALEASGRHDAMVELFLRSQMLSTIFSFAVCTLLFLFGERFIVLWIGETYRDAGTVLMILLVSYAFSLSQNPSIRLMYAIDRHYYYAIATIVEGLLNLGISIALAHEYGIYGVAWGTAISTLLVKVLFQPIYVSRVVGLSLWSYVSVLVWMSLISGLAIWGATAIGAQHWLEANAWLGLVAVVGIGCVISAGLGAVLIRLMDRELFRMMVERAVRWASGR